MLLGCPQVTEDGRAAAIVEEFGHPWHHAGEALLLRELHRSGFLLWQAAYSELYFCDVYWPGFQKIDFLRALRSYAVRSRRFGA